MNASARAPRVLSLSPASDRSRPRRLLEFEGPSALETPQLLALLLGPRSSERAAEELGRALRGEVPLGPLRPSALQQLGLGLAAAERLVCALELGRRLLLAPTRLPLARPLDAGQVASWACPRLGQLSHEEVWVLCVDGRSVLRSTFQVGKGGLHGCSLLPRDVLGPAVRQSAAGFVLVHNHPSGDPSPSPEDLELTRVLGSAARLVGTPLLDHVIVAGSRHVSLAELEGGRLR